MKVIALACYLFPYNRYSEANCYKGTAKIASTCTGVATNNFKGEGEATLMASQTIYPDMKSNSPIASRQVTERHH